MPEHRHLSMLSARRARLALLQWLQHRCKRRSLWRDAAPAVKG